MRAQPAASRNAGLTIADPLDEMIGAGVRMSFDHDAEIFGEGEPATWLYKVVKGAVRSFRVLDDGRRQVVAFHLPGEIFGLETADTHRLSAEAISLSQVTAVRRSSLVQRAAGDGRLAGLLWALTGKELAATQEGRLRFLLTAQERVASFLLEMAARPGKTGTGQTGDVVDLPMSRLDIADYLGLTIETVSRTFTALADQGAIDLPNARRVVLADRAALARHEERGK